MTQSLGRTALLLVWTLCVTGCGEDDGPTVTACGEGQVDDGGTCVPEVCGTGTWGELVTDGDTLFVDAQVSADGDGSKDAPFQTLEKALSEAESSGRLHVAVAAGTYHETLYLEEELSGLELTGRCAELVVLDGSTSDIDDVATVEVAGSFSHKYTLSGLTLQGGEFAAFSVVSGVAIVESCRLVESEWNGAYAGGPSARLTLTDVEIADIQGSWDGKYGYGVYLHDGATLEATGLQVSGAIEFGVVSYDCSVELERVEIRDTVPRDGTGAGYGLYVLDSELTATDLTLSGNSEASLMILGSDAVIEQLQIGPTLVGNEGRARGLVVAEDSTLTLKDGSILDSGDFGLLADASSLTLEQVLVQGLVGDGDSIGAGITLNEAWLDAQACRVEDAVRTGINLVASEATLDGVWIGGTEPLSVDSCAAIQAYESTLQGLDCTIEDNRGVGLLAYGADVTLSGFTIEDTWSLESGSGGYGIQALGSVLQVSSSTISGSHGLGLGLQSSLVTLDEVEVLDTHR
ncbi:MAG: right-handed parallel beta-helix repeat-containing protein, partial [Myxococcota bacterium]|nr:right-handed parallel beta-helix repeat-containing protein [Myxococcota bacterium]